MQEGGWEFFSLEPLFSVVLYNVTKKKDCQELILIFREGDLAGDWSVEFCVSDRSPDGFGQIS